MSTEEYRPGHSKMKLSGISVVVPVYNSEASLAELIARLGPVLKACACAFEVVLVNDGSRDGSWRVICELGEENHFVRGLNLMRNYGQHNALLAGIRAAEHDTIVTIDDDLQHPPEEIPKLLDKLGEGCDVVYGTPQMRQHGLWRNMGAGIAKFALQSAMGAETARKVSAFRAFRSQLRDAFADYWSPFVSVDVLLTWGTTRFAATPVRHEARPVGASNYTFRKLTAHALDMMTGFSTVPLRLASLIGFASAAFGIAVLAYVVGRYVIEGGSVPGFPFLASIIAIFAGAQLFALGIMGEYLARMHFRMMDRPPYVIDSTFESGHSTEEQHGHRRQ